MLLCAAALACGSFGVGIDAARAAGGGDRPLLVFVLRFADSAADAQWVGPWDQSFALDRFFGAGDASVNGYVKVASGGAFSFRPAAEAQGQVNDGIVEVNYPGSMADFRNSQRAALGAMRASDDLVDYTRFDTDGDQVLEPQELAIELVELVGDATRSPETGPLCCMESPDGIDGLAFARDLNVAAVNATSNQMTTIHELFHQAFATIDGYGWGVGQLDVMGPTMDVPDAARWLPNAVTRLEAGWLRPTIVEADAMPLLEVGDAVIVRDPSAGNSQYFVVEYRNGAGLDREASAAGIVVWRVVTSPRRVELITPAVIASDTRVSGCEGGCRRGSTTDAFAAELEPADWLALHQPVVALQRGTVHRHRAHADEWRRQRADRRAVPRSRADGGAHTRRGRADHDGVSSAVACDIHAGASPAAGRGGRGCSCGRDTVVGRRRTTPSHGVRSRPAGVLAGAARTGTTRLVGGHDLERQRACGGERSVDTVVDVAPHDTRAPTRPQRRGHRAREARFDARQVVHSEIGGHDELVGGEAGHGEATADEVGERRGDAALQVAARSGVPHVKGKVDDQFGVALLHRDHLEGREHVLAALHELHERRDRLLHLRWVVGRVSRWVMRSRSCRTKRGTLIP